MNHDLTPREWEIAQLLAEAYTCREVGKILYLSTRTVENHRAAIYDKIGVHSQHGIYLYVQWRKNYKIPSIILPAEYPITDRQHCFIDADIWELWQWPKGAIGQQ